MAKTWAQLSREQAERVRGERNPMKRPEVAAKVAEAMRQRFAQDPQLKAQFVAAGTAASNTPEKNASRRAKLIAHWNEERKQEARERQKAYWSKVKAALAAVGESQHGNENTAS